MKLSKRIKISLASAAVAAGITLTGIIFATDYSAEDPLISKSWLDNVFKPEITQYIDAKVAESVTQSAPDTSEDAAASSDTSYEVVTLTNGQKLTGTEGSLEIILRPGGTATVYSEIPSNGIADLTAGTELLSGTDIPINAYCLVPRADGRGIVCTSETAYVMVRGKYEIK